MALLDGQRRKAATRKITRNKGMTYGDVADKRKSAGNKSLAAAGVSRPKKAAAAPKKAASPSGMNSKKYGPGQTLAKSGVSRPKTVSKATPVAKGDTSRMKANSTNAGKKVYDPTAGRARNKLAKNIAQAAKKTGETPAAMAARLKKRYEDRKAARAKK